MTTLPPCAMKRRTQPAPRPDAPPVTRKVRCGSCIVKLHGLVGRIIQYRFMTRTFTVLAGIVTLLLLATIGVGLWHFVTEDRARRDEIFVIHFVLGLCAALGVLLVHCIIFTYFLGTGRWVKEVTLAYRLPDA